MKNLSRAPFLTLVTAIMLFSACLPAKTSSQDLNKPNPTLKTVILKVNNIDITAEVARTELERNRGLMFRKSLPEGKGMLFVFDYDQKVAFWMKNTSLPLSVAYIASDGTITQILDLMPFSEEPRPSMRSVRYALEVPQGWFAKMNIKPGDVISIPALK